MALPKPIAAAAATYRTIMQRGLPRAMLLGEGSKLMYVLGVMCDLVGIKVRGAMTMSLPSVCPDDQLPNLGRDRGIIRGVRETSQSYRTRLKGWRNPHGHKTRGTPMALLLQAQAAFRGVSHATIDQRGKTLTLDSEGTLTRTDSLDFDWDGEADATHWGRYWLVIETESGPWPTFDEGGWGATFDGADENACLAGPGVDSREFTTLSALTNVRSRPTWSPAGTRPVSVIVVYNGETVVLPTDGTWAKGENRHVGQDYEPLHPDYT